MNILIEGAPSNLSYEEIQKAILQTKGVTGIFELHIWCVTSGMNALSAHVVVMDMESSNRILQDINAVLEKRFKISHTTIQIEGYHPTKDSKNTRTLRSYNVTKSFLDRNKLLLPNLKNTQSLNRFNV